MAPHTRPRPSSIDQLPEECEGIVAWAAQELANTPRSQTDVLCGVPQQADCAPGRTRPRLRYPALLLFQPTQPAPGKADPEDAAQPGYRQCRCGQHERCGCRQADPGIHPHAEDTAGRGHGERRRRRPEFQEAREAATALRQLALAETASTGQRLKLEAEEKLRMVEAEMKDKAEKALDVLSAEPGISKEAIGVRAVNSSASGRRNQRAQPNEHAALPGLPQGKWIDPPVSPRTGKASGGIPARWRYSRRS